MLPEMTGRVTGRKAGEKGEGKGSREKHKESRGSRQRGRENPGASCVHLADRRDSWSRGAALALAAPVACVSHSESECITCVALPSSASLALLLSRSLSPPLACDSRETASVCIRSPTQGETEGRSRGRRQLVSPHLRHSPASCLAPRVSFPVSRSAVAHALHEATH